MIVHCANMAHMFTIHGNEPGTIATENEDA